MAWRESNGHQQCNRCHQALAAGATCWLGHLTRQSWCATCAQELGFDGHPPVEDVAAMTSARDMAAWLTRLRAKAAPQPMRSWTDREEP